MMTSVVSNLQSIKQDGRKIIGCFPLYPPLELFHSLGLIPVVLWGLNKSISTVDESDKHLQSYTCSVARRLAEFVLGETGSILDGLFIYNACDTLRNMPEILESGLDDSGRHQSLFRMHIPMAPPDQTDSTPYLKNELRVLIGELESSYNVSLSDGRFKESVQLYREMRRLSLAASQRVAEGKSSFIDYCAVCEKNLFLPVEAQIESLNHLLQMDNLTANEETSGRIVLSGILPPPPSIIDAIESSGLRIVANDIASLYRSFAYTPVQSISVEAYYVDFYANHFPCTTILHSADRRIGALADLVEQSRAQGVVFIGEKFCEYEYFEFPFLEKTFKSRNVKTLQLEFSIDDETNIGAYQTRIEAFSELIGAMNGS